MTSVKDMEIIKIKPQGICMGVARAINIINKVLQDENTKKPIYMLGNLVHNKNIVRAFQSKGIIVLEGQSRLEMLKSVDEGTVIFTAHGVSEDVRAEAFRKGLSIIDATCRDVEKTHEIIKEKLAQGYKILFYGVLGHPETEGVLGLSADITLVNDDSDLAAIPNGNPKTLLTNQTTMSYIDVLNFYRKIKVLRPNLELLEEVCSATRNRQTAVIENKDNIDLLIVVGDPLSNNTRMLKETAEKKAGLTTVLVENIKGLEGFDFSPYQRVGITAGASTPDAIVEEIIANLKTKKPVFSSKLTDEDFLN